MIRCQVCRHPRRKIIDRELILRRLSGQEIADRYRLHYKAVSRHRIAHLGIEVIAEQLARHGRPPVARQPFEEFTSLSRLRKKLVE